LGSFSKCHSQRHGKGTIDKQRRSWEMWEEFFLIAQSDRKGKIERRRNPKIRFGPFVMSGQIVHRPLDGKVGRWESFPKHFLQLLAWEFFLEGVMGMVAPSTLLHKDIPVSAKHKGFFNS